MRSRAGGRWSQDCIIALENFLKMSIEASAMVEREIIVHWQKFLAILDHAAQFAAQPVTAPNILAREAFGEVGLHDRGMPLDGFFEPIRQNDLRHLAADLLGQSRESLLCFCVCIWPDR